ncbi:MAG: hypothetical protein JST16_05895 [Bdellovibrionales bacterium]|nr:hypothetical protein [Bdellovibrionales bacterium]
MKKIWNQKNLIWHLSVGCLVALSACNSDWDHLIGKRTDDYGARTPYVPQDTTPSENNKCSLDAKGTPVLGKVEDQAAAPSNVSADECGDPRESFKWVDMTPVDGKTLRVAFDVLRQKQVGYASIEKLSYRNVSTGGTLSFKCQPSTYGYAGVMDCTVQCLTPSDASKVCLPQNYTNYAIASDDDGHYVLSEIVITSVPFAGASANACSAPQSGIVRVDFSSTDGGDSSCDNISRARSVSGFKFPSLNSVSVPHSN